MTSTRSDSSTKVQLTTTTHFNTSKTKVTDDVKKLYKVIKKHSGAVGGYGHNGPVYGEVTMVSFQKIVDYLAENLNFGPHSSFLDIGAGLGKPNLHVAVSPGVEYSFGIEIEHLRWQLGVHNLRYCLQDASLDKITQMKKHPNVYFGKNDITDIAHFQPMTHIYQFDIGFPPNVLQAIANAFNVSRTVQALISFQPPRRIIDTYGFAVEHVGKIQTRMCGSSEGHTAYIYKSILNPLVPPASKEQSEVTVSETEPVVRDGRSTRKRRRTQQPQLDKIFSKVTRKGKSFGPKTLFSEDGATPMPTPGQGSLSLTDVDPMFQVGFDMLTPQTADGDRVLLSEEYSQFVGCSGGLLEDCGKRTRRCVSKRVLSYV